MPSGLAEYTMAFVKYIFGKRMQFWSCKPILACFWGSLICMKWKCLRALSDSWGPILALSEACGYINFTRKNNLKTFHTWEVGHSWIYARIYCVESEGYMLDGGSNLSLRLSGGWRKSGLWILARVIFVWFLLLMATESCYTWYHIGMIHFTLIPICSSSQC